MRADIAKHARELVGIPWVHLGRNPTVGLDCIGFMLEVAERSGFPVRQYDKPAYSRLPDGRTLLECFAKGAYRVNDVQEGDLGVFWFSRNILPTHVAFFLHSPTVAGAWNLAHSYSFGPRAVVENIYDQYWQDRLHSVWRFI